MAINAIDEYLKNASVFNVIIPSTDHATLKLNYRQSKPHSTWLDWGDGSQREAFEREGLVEASHTYAEPGEYDITLFAVDEGKIEIAFFGNEYGDDDGYRNMLAQAVIGIDVTKIDDYAFTDCENLESLTFLSDDTEIDNFAFSHCGSLEEVALPKNLTMLSNGVFFDCGSLKKVTLGEGTGVIGPNAFYGCANLKTIDLSTVQKIEVSAFQSCKKLTNVILNEYATDIEDGVFENCANLRTINLGTKMTNIGPQAFCNCKALTEVEIPDTIKTIGGAAFKNCTFAKEIKMAGETAPVLEGSDAFEGMKNFKITVPRGCRRNYVDETNWTVYTDFIEERWV